MSDITYHSPAGRITFFKQMVIFTVIGSVLMIASQFMVIAFVTNRFAEAVLTRPAFGDYIMLEALAYGAVVVFFLGFAGTVISSLMLIHRLTANANALGLPTENTPAWAVGWWFVPIANFYKPYQHLMDLMIKTAHGGADTGRLGRVMLIWWLAWVIHNIVTSITEKLLGEPTTINDVVITSSVTIVQELIGVAVLFGYYFVLRGLTELQEMRSRLVDVF